MLPVLRNCPSLKTQYISVVLRWAVPLAGGFDVVIVRTRDITGCGWGHGFQRTGDL